RRSSPGSAGRWDRTSPASCLGKQSHLGGGGRITAAAQRGKAKVQRPRAKEEEVIGHLRWHTPAARKGWSAGHQTRKEPGERSEHLRASGASEPARSAATFAQRGRS